MGRIDEIVRRFGMISKQRTIIGGVIVDEIGQGENSPFLGHRLNECSDVRVSSFEQRIQLVMVGHSVRRVRHVIQQLNRSEVKEIVTRLMCHFESRRPITNWTQRLREHRLTSDRILIENFASAVWPT